MALNNSEVQEINNSNVNQNNYSEAGGIKPRIVKTAYTKPTHSELEINFQKFVKDYKCPVILKTIDDFPAWFRNTTYALNFLGLNDVIKSLIDARIDGQLISYNPDEENVIKQLLGLTVDNNKFIISSESSVQDILYNLVCSIGLVRAYKEVIRYEAEFRIDIRDSLEANLRKWDIAERMFIWSKYKYDTNRILINIRDGFPKHHSFESLKELLRKHKNSKDIDIAAAIRDIHKLVADKCDMDPIDEVYQFDDDHKNKYNESVKIQGIKKDYKNKNKKNKFNKKNYKKGKANKEMEDRARHFSMKNVRFPKHCVFCGENHPPYICEKKVDGACWWCGVLGHKMGVCEVKEEEEAKMKVNALLENNVTRRMFINAARKDDDLRTRISAIDKNNMCSGIVLDTGAQASVTGCINNLHSYFPLSESEQNTMKSVTNTPIKILGYGILKLKLDFSHPKVVDIPVYHCSNIDGTFISDDDLINAGIDYRSIDGIPYLFWNNERIELIKGDNLIYIPPSMFLVEKNLVAGIHEALGHVEKSVAERSVAEGFVQVDDSELKNSLKEKCLTCQIGKARRCNHRAGSRDKYVIPIPLHTFHADLLYINVDESDLEPVEDIAFQEYKWVLAFTDDYSKMCFAFPLRRKNEFLFQFVRFYNYLKNTFNASLVVLHTDQGTEFINKATKNVYDSLGITHVVTNGYASMENGVAERRNLTIKNDIKTNLVAAKLDYALWPAVMEYVVSIRNKTVISGMDLSPESIILRYYRPESDLSEIYPHRFKSFGRHGIWYDVASKVPSLMKIGIHCFYLGPSQYPCAADTRVLNGDKILVFIPQADGYYKPAIKYTTNVQYSYPVRLFKDMNLAELGIKLRPVDTQTPNSNLSQVVEKRDGKAQADTAVDKSQIQVPIISQVPHENSVNNNDVIMTDAKSGGDARDVDVSNVDKAIVQDAVVGDDVARDDVHMLDVESNGPIPDGVHDDCPADGILESNVEDDRKQDEPEISSTVGTSIDVDNKLTGDVDVNPEVGVADNGSTDEIEEISTEDVEKLKSFERVVKEGNIGDIIEASKENLVETKVDKELQNYFNPQDTISIPEGRLLRSRFQFKGVNAVKIVPDFSKDPGELPSPKRIIYQVVSKDPIEGPEWVAAFNNELNSHRQNGSWDFNPIITGDPEILKRTVRLDVICNEKRAAVGERPKKKVRFVLRGDRQDESTYSNTYSPTLPYDLLRIILAECVQSRRYSVFLDISTAYLNAEIDHEIYVELPAVLEKDKPKVRIGEKVVHKVKRAIYGLKQSGRLWYQRLTNFLISIGFESRGDIPCVLIKPMKNNSEKISIIVGFFVDDMVVTGVNKLEVDRFVERLNDEFNLRITNPDNNGYRDILGINVKENKDKRSGTLLSMDLSMSNYIKKMIIKLGFEKEFKRSRKISTPMTPNFQFDKEKESELVFTGEQLAQEIHWFREVVGCLQYLANALRPDLSYVANYMARFCMYPHPKLKAELIRTLRYTYHTREYKIRYTRFTSDVERFQGSLITYSDSDYAGDVMTRKSTLSSIFMMNGGPVAWFARVAKFAATSSTDAEVAAMVEAGNGVSYYREVLSFLKVLSSAYSRKGEYENYNGNSGGELLERVKLDPLIIFVDNSSAIYLAQKGVTSGRTKHMAVRVGRAHDIMESEHVLYRHIGTKEMLADILTKPVTAEVMNTLLQRILVTESPKVKNI